MSNKNYTKIYISGSDLDGKYLLIFSDGIYIDRIQIRHRSVIVKFFWQSVYLEYFISRLSKIVLLKLVVSKLMTLFHQNKSKFLRQYILGFCVETRKVSANGVLSFAVEFDSRKVWASRSAINQKIKPLSLNHSIEYDMTRFPNHFSAFIWGVKRPNDDENYKLVLGLKTRLDFKKMRLADQILQGLLTFHEVTDCSILHSRTAVVADTLVPTDYFNFMDNSWPSDGAIKLGENFFCITSIEKENFTDQSAVFFGSSTSWFHFLIEIFPRFIRFGADKIRDLVPVLEHDVPIQILDVLRLLTPHEAIKLRPFEITHFKELTLCIEARYPKGLELLDRKEDIILVRDFFANKFNLDRAQLSRKIFLTRDKNLFRNNRGFSQIIDFFKQAGFEIINCGNISMFDQIMIFSQARIVVGETGSALTNLIFCHQDCRVVEINMHKFMQGFFKDFCHNLNLNHIELDRIYLKSGELKFSAEGKDINPDFLI
jgi:hypothetical protein